MGGFYSEDFEDLESTWEQARDILYHSVLPLLAYVAGSFAVMTFMMKNALMDNLAADYVRTAIAKGLPFRKAITHIDGLGLLGYESIVERDYPIVLGVLVISAILQLLGNILSDICVAVVDPRVQFK